MKRLAVALAAAFLLVVGCSSSSDEEVLDSGGGTAQEVSGGEEIAGGEHTAGGEELPKWTEMVSSQSYKGHENDQDSNYFVTVYNDALGTRLDDCQTCHRGGTFSYEQKGQQVTAFKNSCDYCHLIIHPQEFNEPLPTTYEETLNSYGLAYKDAGRSLEALVAIEGEDSDGDEAINVDEIADLKYPGDPDSKPGQDVAPLKTFTLEELQAMDAHSEFMLSNSHKQQFDNYATYKGVKVRDLLVAAGVDLEDEAIQGVTIVAPDGYMKDFTMEKVTTQYPNGLFYDGLDTATLGPDCGFVQYPDELPDGLVSGGEIPDEQWLVLAYERDGMAMDPSVLDPTSGKINGEGPFRVAVPQSNPGEPDRGSKYSPTECADGYDYDDNKDHNAGDMVRGVVAIRVNPLPEGYEDFDYKYGGWAFIAKESVIVYGHGVTAD